MTSQMGRARTKHASRYLQQLAKHWSHGNEVVFDTTNADIALRGNRVQMSADSDGLVATLTTGPGGDVVQLRKVFEEHINRFAFRESPLQFEWSEA